MVVAGSNVVWAPQAGSQDLALRCPVFELLYEGTRGVGKTDWLLMDFAQEIGKGYGRRWRGIVFRRTYKSLDEIVEKSLRWFPRIFPGAKWKSSSDQFKWVFPTGEQLLLRHFEKFSDYWKYHGHEYPWIGWDELTNWANLIGYHSMKSCCRTSMPGIPLRYRATANPWGIGHNAVKAYFIDPAPAGRIISEPMTIEGMGEVEVKRVRIRGHWSENKVLLAADPGYPARIAQAATNPAQREAWLDGSWDIVAGGMFDDLWNRDVHVLPDFEPPSSWRLDRAYDHGSSAPFSVGWWAESDGTDAEIPGRGKAPFPRGSLVRMHEWYGWNGKDANVGLRLTDTAIGKGIAEREERWKLKGRVQPGPADTTIFYAEPGKKSLHDEAFVPAGVRFIEADKRPGSRISGWEKCRRMLEAATESPPTEPGLFTMERCAQFVRTFPTLPRSEKDLDDVDTEAEDHVGDETRYRVWAPKKGASSTPLRV